jgi:hypothetical protein
VGRGGHALNSRALYTQGNRYVTTLHAIVSGVRKLAQAPTLPCSSTPSELSFGAGRADVVPSGLGSLTLG